jgi:AraC family transcriptional regulator
MVVLSMAQTAHVPVTMGSPRFRVIDVATCRVTDAWFPPNAYLEPHTHERSIFAVMLAGSFTNRIAGRQQECAPASFWSEPLGEKHDNRCAAHGARVFVVQPDPQHLHAFAPFSELLGNVRHARDGSVALDAHRAIREFAFADTLAPLAIESFVFAMLVSAARVALRSHEHERPPRWVRHARDFVHENYRRRFLLSEVAALVGVEPSRLAHGFRRWYGRTIGDYARAERLTWALEQLEQSNRSIAAIAVAAGYCDQSHFTRDVRAALGEGPAAYRRRHSYRSVPLGQTDEL